MTWYFELLVHIFWAFTNEYAVWGSFAILLREFNKAC